MSSWARVGVKCVCVDDARRDGYSHDNPCPRRSSVVEIIGVWMHPKQGQTLIIKGWPNFCVNHGRDVGWKISRFRPLQTISQADDIAMFRKLIETMKPTERLDALREMLDAQ
jgi:hypothetical protein